MKKNIRNILFLSLCVGAMLTSCKKEDNTGQADPNEAVTAAPKPAAETAESPAAEKKDAMASFKDCLAAFNSKNEAAYGNCYDDSSEWGMIDFAPPMSGKGRPSPKPVWIAFPDMNSEAQLVLQNGDKTASILLTQGTNSGPHMGMPASNKKLSIFETQLMAFSESGTVRTAHFLTDHATMAHQLGMHKNERSPDSETAWADKQWITAENNDAEKANVDLVKQMAANMDNGDHDGYLARVADDISFRYTGDKNPMNGIKAYKEGFKKWADMAEHKTTLVEAWGAGDWVVAVSDNIHTLKKDLPGTKDTKGKEVKTRTIEFMQLSEGKLKTHWVFENSMAYAVQLGLMDMKKDMHKKADENAPSKKAN